MTAETWDDERTRCFGMLLDGRAQVSGIRRRGEDGTLLIVFNAHHDLVKFALPGCAQCSGWSRLFDTNDASLPEQKFEIGAVYDVTGRSMLLFERVPDAKEGSKATSGHGESSRAQLSEMGLGAPPRSSGLVIGRDRSRARGEMELTPGQDRERQGLEPTAERSGRVEAAAAKHIEPVAFGQPRLGAPFGLRLAQGGKARDQNR